MSLFALDTNFSYYNFSCPKYLYGINRKTSKLKRARAATTQQPPRLTGDQLRAARAMLRLSQRQFAEYLQLGVASLRNLERQTGELTLESPAIARIVKALNRAGIELLPAGLYMGSGGPGLRLKRRRVKAEPKPMSEEAGATTRRKKKPKPEIAA